MEAEARRQGMAVPAAVPQEKDGISISGQSASGHDAVLLSPPRQGEERGAGPGSPGDDVTISWVTPDQSPERGGRAATADESTGNDWSLEESMHSLSYSNDGSDDGDVEEEDPA